MRIRIQLNVPACTKQTIEKLIIKAFKCPPQIRCWLNVPACAKRRSKKGRR